MNSRTFIVFLCLFVKLSVIVARSFVQTFAETDLSAPMVPETAVGI